jgi:peptidyl-prolyl cis-trans isomerase SurA
MNEVKSQTNNVLMTFKTIIFLLISFSIFGQITEKQLSNVPPVAQIVQPEPNVVSIGKKTFSLKDFTLLYRRNLQTDSVSDKTPKQFLDQFISNQLKVLKAEDEGIDTTFTFKEEMTTIRKELASSFMVEKSVNDALIKEAYERLETEVNVSHILIRVNDFNNPIDTLAAYNKIIDLRNRILAGEKFSEIAVKFSEDKSAIKDEGNLGYITAFQTVYPFETASYNTPVGKLSMPFRTSLGYHILKVTAKREYQRWKAAHIFININAQSTEAELQASKKKIDDIYSKLQTGESFEKLARLYSEDATTNTKAGVFKRLFGTDELEKPFEEALFSLKKNGSYSTPIRTSKGWHIIRLVEKQELKPFNEMYNYLQNKVAADKRAELSKNALVQRIKKENGFKEYLSVKNDCKELIDSVLTLNSSLRSVKSDLNTKVIFSIGEKEIFVKNFIDYVNEKATKSKVKFEKNMLEQWYKDFEISENLAYEESVLEKKNQEFGVLMNEYRENILVQNVLEGQVWTNMIQDTEGQREFYNKNAEKYILPERVKLELFDANSTENLKKFKNIFAKSPYPLSFKWNDLIFDLNSSQLTETHKQHLTDLALLLLKNENYKVEISGNIDPDESEKISNERAQNAVKFIVKLGVGLDRIIEKDNGKFQPLSKTEREKNRRVSFSLSTTNKQDIVKLYNVLKPESIKVMNGAFKKGESKTVDLLKWVEGEQELEKSGRHIFARIERVEPSRKMTFEESKGKIIKAMQVAKELEMMEKLKVAFPVIINEEQLKKVSK